MRRRNIPSLLTLVTDEYSVTLEERQFGLIQRVTAWGLLSALVEHSTILEYLDMRDLVVRDRITSEVLYQTGPLLRSEAVVAAERVHSVLVSDGRAACRDDVVLLVRGALRESLSDSD